MKLKKKTEINRNKNLNSTNDAQTFSNDNIDNIDNNEELCTLNDKDYRKTELHDKEYPMQLKIDDNNTTNEDKEKLEEAAEAVKKQSNKNKKWWNLIFLIINVAVVAGILTYQLLNEESVIPLAELSSKLNGWVILLTVVVFALINFLETAKFWILTYKATNKSRFALSYKIAALGKYYDNVTPFATGEQPFQIYYLNKHGVSGSDSVSIPMGKYVIWQLSFVTFTLIVMIFSISLDNFANAGTAVVTTGSWIGFIINSALVFLVGLISISKKVGTKLITGILKLLHKMKIVKNYEKQYNKVIEMVDDYQTTMRKYAKDKLIFFSELFITYVTFILHYSLPFLIYSAFYGFNFALFFPIMTYCVMIELTASFLPLPGGTGAAELSFTALFSMYFGGGYLFWAMIIWRIFTYYAYIIQGLIILVYDYLLGNKRYQWEEKKWALEAESRTFEENHLKQFEISLQKSKKNKKEKIL